MTDISDKIRDLSISSKVKFIARVKGVRESLVVMQRELSQKYKGAVMEGRDIGTVVFPDAKYKFFIDASFEERVQRRLAELRAKGHPVTREEVSEDLKQRDHTDKTRKAGPLKKAKDAVFIDTTDLSIDEVVKRIVQHVNKK